MHSGNEIESSAGGLGIKQRGNETGRGGIDRGSFSLFLRKEMSKTKRNSFNVRGRKLKSVGNVFVCVSCGFLEYTARAGGGSRCDSCV